MSGVNKFIVRVLFMAVLLSLLISLFISTKANGNLDPYYMRFTSDKSSSMILGTSRAAQGIVPSVLEKELSDPSIDKPIHNFSFTLIHSSYGATYLAAIKKKINPQVTDGLFILTVDPWSVSTVSKTDNPSEFLETATFMASLDNMSASPNFEYLLHHYDGPFFKAFKKRATFLHDDGWLEVSIPMDSISVRKRSVQKYKDYAANAEKYRFSANRFNALKETIVELQKHGKVVLVRLPVSLQMKKIEESYMTDFDDRIKILETTYTTPYLNLIDKSGTFPTTDGNHLSKNAARAVTSSITNWINNNQYDK